MASWFEQLDLGSLQDQIAKSVEEASSLLANANKLDILNFDEMAIQEEEDLKNEEEEEDDEDDEPEPTSEAPLFVVSDVASTGSSLLNVPDQDLKSKTTSKPIIRKLNFNEDEDPFFGGDFNSKAKNNDRKSSSSSSDPTNSKVRGKSMLNVSNSTTKLVVPSSPLEEMSSSVGSFSVTEPTKDSHASDNEKSPPSHFSGSSDTTTNEGSSDQASVVTGSGGSADGAFEKKVIKSSAHLSNSSKTAKDRNNKANKTSTTSTSPVDSILSSEYASSPFLDIPLSEIKQARNRQETQGTVSDDNSSGNEGPVVGDVPKQSSYEEQPSASITRQESTPARNGNSVSHSNLVSSGNQMNSSNNTHSDTTSSAAVHSSGNRKVKYVVEEEFEYILPTRKPPPQVSTPAAVVSSVPTPISNNTSNRNDNQSQHAATHQSVDGSAAPAAVTANNNNKKGKKVKEKKPKNLDFWGTTSKKTLKFAQNPSNGAHAPATPNVLSNTAPTESPGYNNSSNYNNSSHDSQSGNNHSMVKNLNKNEEFSAHSNNISIGLLSDDIYSVAEEEQGELPAVLSFLNPSISSQNNNSAMKSDIESNSTTTNSSSNNSTSNSILSMSNPFLSKISAANTTTVNNQNTTMFSFFDNIETEIDMEDDPILKQVKHNREHPANISDGSILTRLYVGAAQTYSGGSSISSTVGNNNNPTMYQIFNALSSSFSSTAPPTNSASSSISSGSSGGSNSTNSRNNMSLEEFNRTQQANRSDPEAGIPDSSTPDGADTTLTVPLRVLIGNYIKQSLLFLWDNMFSTNGITVITGLLFMYSYYKFQRYGTDAGDR